MEQPIIKIIHTISILFLDILHKTYTSDNLIKDEIKSLAIDLKKSQTFEDYRNILISSSELQKKIASSIQLSQTISNENLNPFQKKTISNEDFNKIENLNSDKYKNFSIQNISDYNSIFEYNRLLMLSIWKKISFFYFDKKNYNYLEKTSLELLKSTTFFNNIISEKDKRENFESLNRVLDLQKKFDEALSDYITGFETYLSEIEQLKEKNRALSEIATDTIETLSKIPFYGNQYQSKLETIRSNLLNSSSINDLKALKKELLDTMDNFQDGIFEFSQKITDSLKEAQQRIEFLEKRLNKATEEIYLDGLTGTKNRKWLEDSFEEYFWFGKNENFVAALLDIDFFKKINDTYGHQMGDFVLKELTSLIKGMLRGDDLIVRYGGEEFLILMAKVFPEHVDSIFQRILKKVESTIFKKGELELNCTISIGVSYFYEANSVSELLEKTDQKLYKAKRDGRNRVIFSI
ncbi:diguanylate cyclase [bacterium]|nr:diguanylate cyclase [bacterium]